MLTFLAYYPNKIKTVVLNHPHGSTVTYQILIDKGYYGVIRKVNGEWKCDLHNPKLLYAEDVSVLEDIVTDYHNWKDTIGICQMLRFDHKTEAWPASGLLGPKWLTEG